MKEAIIIIVVITLVTISSFITQNYLETTSDEILGKLTELKTKIAMLEENDNTNDINQMATQIIEKWEEVNKNWSMIVIHEELDNIELSLIELKTCIETSELEDGLKELDKSIFLVGHIKDKESFRMKNIF